MTYKPVGVDENSLFPPRVEGRLLASFVAMGNQAAFDAHLAALAPGSPYVWNLTDPAVGLVDILSGVKA